MGMSLKHVQEFFKKFIAFEEKYGTNETQQAVKTKVKEYTV